MASDHLLQQCLRLAVVCLLGSVQVVAQTAATRPGPITLRTLEPGAVDRGYPVVIAARGKSTLVNRDTGVEQPFLDNVYRPFGFSADKRYFLYLKSKGELPGFELTLYDLHNGSERRLGGGTVINARWSAEGTQVAFLSMQSANHFRLEVMELEGAESRVLASGLLDPEYLEWSEDGSGLLYLRMEPLRDDYFHGGEIASELRLVDAGSGSDVAADAADDATWAGKPALRRTTSAGRVFVSATEGRSRVVQRWLPETGSYETVAAGEIYATTPNGIVVREFLPGGVRFQFADAQRRAVTTLGTFTGTWLLPFEGSADLNQGGSLFSGGACDGRACNVVSHNNALGYALDWQQRPNAGMGSTRLLAVEEGTVAGVVTNVTCNSLNTTCQIGWDNYSSQCTNTNGGAGNYVVLAHADGSFSFYGHMRSGTSPLVVGQTVVRGAYIGDQGHSGSTGNQNGNYNGCGDHVHFQRQTGPAVWAQSIPTDFAELPCALSCRTNYTSQNVEATAPAAVVALTVQLVPSTIFAGAASPANRVILPAPAPAGGTAIALLSTSGEVSIPATVVVPAGKTHAEFVLSVSGNAAAGPVTITAHDGNSTATASLTVRTVSVFSVVMNPTVMAGGASSIANEVVLSAPLAAGGLINLTSSNTTASVPTEVSVNAGGSFTLFPMTAAPVSSQVSATITASYSATSRSANVIVAPLSISSLSLAATAPVGGSVVMGNRIYFNAPAPPNAVVSVTSSDPAVGSVPDTLSPAEGALSVPFPITTYPVGASTPVVITATVGSSSRNATVNVQPVRPQTLTLSATTAAGGTTVGGNRVTLNGPAPSPNAVVTLTSSDPAVASVPASVTVAAGATQSSNFAITTYGVSTQTTVAITAGLNGVSRTVNLTVTPVSLSSIALGAASAAGGSTVANNRVTLSGPAGAAGVTVNLSSADPAIATVPASITVPAGAAQSPVFSITTSTVGASTPVVMSAELNGTVRTSTLTVLPVSLSSITLSATSAVGGAAVTGNRVNLNGPAPAGGITIALSTSDTALATVPANITIPAGATQANFAITTYAVAANTPVTVSVALNGITRSAALTLRPVALSSVTLSTGSAVGGVTVFANRVNLTGPAGPGGVAVSLSTSDSAVGTVTESLTVPAGSSFVNFPVTTYSVSAPTALTVVASHNGVTRQANLTVNPVALLSVALPSGSAVGGSTVTATARLNGPAPTGGYALTQATSDTSLATVPANLTVPAGASQATFPVTTTYVTAATPVSISASDSALTRSATLTLTVLAPASVSLPSASLVGGNTGTGNRVVLNGPAAPGGTVVNLTTSDAALASVPASVTVAAGAVNSPAFAITTTQVTAATPVTLTATLNGVSRTTTLTIQPTAPISISLTSSTTTGGTVRTGNRVNLNAPAGSSGAAIALASSDPAVASVPATITAPAGATGQTFPITTFAVTASTPVTITATLNGVSRSVVLTVNP